MFNISQNSFALTLDYKAVISHSSATPFMYVGHGQESMSMHLGHFKIKQTDVKLFPLRYAEIIEEEDSLLVHLKASSNGKTLVTLRIEQLDESRLRIHFLSADCSLNRFSIRLLSDKNEKLYGCGEQLSYFNLKGRAFPLWTSEPGIGRDKRKLATFIANCYAGAGGHPYNTSYPQPTYISSYKYFLHLQSSAYMNFDFRNEAYTEISAWDKPDSLELQSADNFIDLSRKVSAYFGKQPPLPDWMYNGVILGVQGGTQAVLEKLKFAKANGIPVSALWCQDWQGKRITSFGKRLMWNWQWNKEEYPGLDEKIKELRSQNIRFLGYINPYLAIDGALYQEGTPHDYFVKNPRGTDYILDFGEFECGTVDLTNPHAWEWYKNIIKKNLIAFGLSGWMADFGEYLPPDAQLYDGSTGKTTHNLWPLLWAKLNREAIEETGNLGKIVFFMRSGFTGSQAYCPLLWAGDQFVDFSRHDGLVSVICGALSSAVIGNGFHHSDIGGYTSFLKFSRSKELLIRWAEMAAFTPVMRTHEGNRPEHNYQFYDDAHSAQMLGRLSSVHRTLTPYLKQLVELNSVHGIPVQRPLFYHFEEDAKAYTIQDEYLLGEDLLVAPVWKRGAKKRTLYLPNGGWVHLFSGKDYCGGGMVTVDAPLGVPPVFYRKASASANLFQSISAIF